MVKQNFVELVVAEHTYFLAVRTAAVAVAVVEIEFELEEHRKNCLHLLSLRSERDYPQTHR